MTATDEQAPVEPDARPSPAAPKTPPGRAWLRAHGWGMTDRLGAPLLVWLLTFPNLSRPPVASLDGSYRVALQLAQARGLQFGTKFVYVWGPLGFLSVPEGYFGRGTLLSIATFALVRLGLVVLTYRVVRRVLPSIPAAAITYVLVSLFGLLTPRLSDMVFALLALSCVVLLTSTPPAGWRVYASIGYLALLTSVLLLLKLNDGVFGLAVSVVAVLALALRRRAAVLRVIADLAVLGGACAGLTVIWWLLSGQRLSHLVPYVRTWGALTQGHVTGMGVEQSGRQWELAVAALVVAGVGYAAWRSRKRSESFAPAAVVVIAGVVLYALFREGFVRHDFDHSFIFFVSAAILAVGFLQRDSLPVVASVVVLALVSGLVARSADVPSLVDPIRHVNALGNQAELAFSKGARVRRRDEGTRALTRRYELTPATLAALEGHTVHASPWDAGVFAAYPGLAWDPPPVFQEFLAYETSLDRLNQRFLESDAAPEFILRQVVAIDGRNPGWESPDAMLTMACNYEWAFGQPHWTVLRRMAPACGAPRTIARTHADIGEAVPIPTVDRCPGILTFSVHGFGDSLAERARALVYKSTEYHVAFSHGPRYRFVPGTAGGQHLLHVPGNPVWVMGQADLGSARSMTIERDGIGAAATGAVDVTFSCVPFRAPAVSGP